MHQISGVSPIGQIFMLMMGEVNSFYSILVKLGKGVLGIAMGGFWLRRCWLTGAIAFCLSACSASPREIAKTYMEALQAGNNSKAQALSCVPKLFETVPPDAINHWQILMQVPNRSEGVPYAETIVRIDMSDGVGAATMTWELWIWKPNDAYKHYQTSQQDAAESNSSDETQPILNPSDWSKRPLCVSRR